jgi:hypothetical protein
MSKKYKYVCVNVNDAGSWLLYGDPLRDKTKTPAIDSLPVLLEDGWIPVREIPAGHVKRKRGFSNENDPVCLVLLEKEV